MERAPSAGTLDYAPPPVLNGWRRALLCILLSLQIGGLLASCLTPALLLAGIMGLAGEGQPGTFHFIMQAFYWSTMLFPLLWLGCTLGALVPVARERLVLACLIQALPFLVPTALYLLAAATARL